ncbi:MAG: hypothetical protein QOG64_2499 [Acidimicrobiaceae bacterium]|nr:hypothetical protein [Acidimicrobiaceae bacterium]
MPGDTGGPHVRLGLAWAVLVLAAAVAGPVVLAVPMLGAAAIGMVEVARRAPSRMVAIVVDLGLVVAAVGPVIVRTRPDGAVIATVLLVAVCLYDAAVFVVGTGATNRWEGPAAGIVTLVPLTVLIAALLVPPFRGSSPWLLGGLTAVLAPWGAPLATRLLGGGDRLGAVRRLDTLLLVGPAWALAAAVMHLH